MSLEKPVCKIRVCIKGRQEKNILLTSSHYLEVYLSLKEPVICQKTRNNPIQTAALGET